MDADRTNDENDTILRKVSQSIKNGNINVLYYPIGFCAYLVDEFLKNNTLPSVIVNNISYFLNSNKLDVSKFAVAEDAVITNKFYLWIESALKENEIYDYDSFLSFMRCNALESYIYKYTEYEEKCRIVINRKEIPDELSM